MADARIADCFVRFFHQPQADQKRGKFLSRLFGVFSEELVRVWARDERAPYRDLGRPTVIDEAGKARTLDFTFEERASGRRFVAEMKCEIEYQNYRFLSLTSPQQLNHHCKPAFAAFLAAAREPAGREVRVQRVAYPIDGAILVWGTVSPEGGRSAIDTYGFHDVIGVDRVIADLQDWDAPELEALASQYRAWSNDLFDFIRTKPQA